MEQLTTRAETQDVNDNENTNTDETVENGSEEVIEDQVAETEETEEVTTDQDETYDSLWDKVSLDDDTDPFTNVEANESQGAETADIPPPAGNSEETVKPLEQTYFLQEAPVLKFKGNEVVIDSPDELVALAQKGMLLEHEAAKNKPFRAIRNIVEENGLSADDIKALADLKSGKKEALGYFKKQYGIEDDTSDDMHDLFSDNTETKNESEYTPEVPEEDPLESYWKTYSEANTQNAAKVAEIYGNLDDSFKNELYQDGVFQSFILSVEQGEFEKVYPYAVKNKALNPSLSWLQAYGMAMQNMQGNTRPQTQTPAADTQIPKQSNTVAKRSVDDYWNDDEAFKELEETLFS